MGSSVNQIKNDTHGQQDEYEEYLQIDESGLVVKAVVKPKGKEFSTKQWKEMMDVFLEKREFGSKLTVMS